MTNFIWKYSMTVSSAIGTLFDMVSIGKCRTSTICNFSDVDKIQNVVGHVLAQKEVDILWK